MRFRSKSSQKDILIVDDDPVFTRILTFHFEKKGFCFDTAMNGQLALDLLRHTSYRTALVDYKMPGMNGFELCEKIRKQHKHRGMHIILMSGEIDSSVAMPEGIDEFVSKPFDMKMIIKKSRGRLSLMGDQTINRVQ